MTSAPLKEKIDQIISQLTLEEKVAFCHANSPFRSGGCERLGISDMEYSDGPHGVRAELNMDWSENREVDSRITYFPVGIALGATWNKNLAYQFGQSLGAEARGRGKDVILGPGVNIVRTPLNGRNFEYLGEDPYHVAHTACETIRGIQKNDVAACIKHFALNNQEKDRHNVDVRCDDRTLREMYLPAFEKAAKEAKVLTVMGAYNRFRGQFCCHHKLLLQKILKDEWGFEGLVVSDWGGVHDSTEAAENGLDVEMGGNIQELHLDRPFLEGLREGRYPESLVDDKVRRILQVAFTIKKDREDRQKGAINTPQHQNVARTMAAESLVLLQNEKSILPLDIKKVKTLAVIGENATMRHGRGGGSSGIKPLYEITPLEGLQELLGDQVEILYAKGYPSLPKNFAPVPTDLLEAPDVSGIGGWSKEVYDNRRATGEPVRVETVPAITFSEESGPPLDRPVGQWSIVWRGKIRVPEAESVEWVIHGWDNWIFRIDGEEVGSVWDLTAPGIKRMPFVLEANRSYEITLFYSPKNENTSLQLGWCRESSQSTAETNDLPDERAEALQVAQKADAVLFFGGTTHMQDVEATDRPGYDLPYQQNDLIAELSAANPNLTVVLTGGSPVRLPWKDQVPAIVQTWYAGCEGGRAIADMLFGRLNPSGKLPVSWPAELEDYAAHAKDAYHANEVEYVEGLFTGYRWHDVADSPKPLFPFGHGLSYTNFSLKNPKIEIPGSGEEVARIGVTIENTGDRPGAEVVQLYLGAENSMAERPLKELKGFSKIFLAPGESQQIFLPLYLRDLSFWNEETHSWTRDIGPFTVWLGNSSSNGPLSLKLEL